MENLKLQEKQITITNERNKVFYEVSKRFFDILLSVIALIVLSPVMLIVFLAIRFDSKGKAIYSQERIGKNLKKIKIYKFRSMYINSDEIFENFTDEQKKEFYKNFKLDNDPRITRIGNFIRKTSLDELPQLINIIKGDMSIVGPRPIVEKEINKYNRHAERVFSIKPGLTGYWQANGRSDTDYDERIKMDIYYLTNRSLSMDIKIIMKTFIAVIKKEGAI